jgi:hypothetical protein
MSQQSVRQAARRSALDAQAVLRKERADRERRLEGLAVNVLTALGERDGAVRDAERRAGEALQTMTIDEGLSLRGRRVVREWRPYRAGGDSATPTGARPARRQRPMSRATHPPSGHSLSHPSGLPHRRVAAALCVELNGLDGGSDDTFR